MQIFNKKIKENFDYEFAIEEKGLYAIEIIASCKSWRQNLIKFISFFKDDDLAIKIDSIEFPKLNAKRGLFDGEAAWNGNNLKGIKKTDVFFIKLESGNHFIHFLIDQEPYLESVNIRKIQDAKNIFYTSEFNNFPEDGGRRQWLNIALVNLPLKNFSITASAGKRGSDDDDLKLIIDGEIEKNTEVNSHKYWYWCGRTLGGKQKEFYKETNLPQGLHYIELWADNTPILDRASFVLEEKLQTSLKDYAYKGVNKNEDYNRYDAVIKEVVDYWNNEFFKDTDSPEKLLDPNLVKAILYQESRVGYYSGAEIDVMQVGNPADPALKTLRGELKEYWIHNNKREILEYTGVKIEAVKESIYWGVRWLYHKAQGIGIDGRRYWRTWEEAVYAYGPGTKEYADSVLLIYKNGIKKEKNNIIRLWTVAFFLLSTFLAGGHNAANALKAAILNSFNQEQQSQIQDIEIKSYKDNASLFLAIIGWDKDWWEELRIGNSKDGAIKWFEMKDLPDEQSILEAKFLNLKGFDNPIVEAYGETHMGHGALYLYEIKDGQLKLLLKTQAVDFNKDIRWAPDNYEKYGYGNCGEIFSGGRLLSDYEDLNKDGILDVVLSGTEEIICEKEIGEGSSGKKEAAGIKVAEIRIRKTFLWNKNKNGYFEK